MAVRQQLHFGFFEVRHVEAGEHVIVGGHWLLVRSVYASGSADMVLLDAQGELAASVTVSEKLAEILEPDPSRPETPEPAIPASAKGRLAYLRGLLDPLEPPEEPASTPDPEASSPPEKKPQRFTVERWNARYHENGDYFRDVGWKLEWEEEYRQAIRYRGPSDCRLWMWSNPETGDFQEFRPMPFGRWVGENLPYRKVEGGRLLYYRPRDGIVDPSVHFNYQPQHIRETWFGY